MWFRNDLRIEDNEAFHSALKSDSLILIYIIDQQFLSKETTSSFHLRFIKDSLTDLENRLETKFYASLNIYCGDTVEIFKNLISKYKISCVYSHNIFKESYIKKVDGDCDALFRYKNIHWEKI